MAIFEDTAEFAGSFLSDLFVKFIVAIVILLIGFVISRIIGKITHRVLHEIELNNIVKKAGAKFEIEKTLSHFVTYFLYFITVIWALDALGLTTTILNMISAAFLLLIIISVSLAVKDFIPSIISGVLIFKKGIIKVGDRVKIDGIDGKVKKISLVDTEIETKNGDTIHIPNSSLTKKEITVKKR